MTPITFAAGQTTSLTRTGITTAVVAAACAAGLVAGTAAPVAAQGTNGSIYTQCPGDTNGDGIPDVVVAGHPNVKCMHLAAGDGYVTMADGKPIYTFGFSDVTGLPPAQIVNAGLAAANFPAPTIRLKEGQEFYLGLTNVGMILRPDLFDAHSVHFHGFPQAAAIFDGVPESSIAIAMGSSMTYYYKIVDGLAGTYMYHCHVEATEHMQMGMLGNLYVEPKQNRIGYPGHAVAARLEGGPTGEPLGYVYNDGDGSTAFDVEQALQIGSFDPNFHDQHIAIQPLPFAAMNDTYPMLNGRGYPDTVNPGVISTESPAGVGLLPSQKLTSLIEATVGDRVLLRLSNLSVTRFYTLASTIPMTVVGRSAKLLRGPSADGVTPGTNLWYTTNSVTLGGGESFDVILHTAGLAPGTYLIYTPNLNYLSNDGEDFGGMMTEIHLN